MCSKTLIYGAEYFLIPAPKITKPIFKKINPLERRIPKVYTSTYLTLFTFKLEPTEVQDAAKSQILNFRSYTHTHTVNGLRKFKVKLSKNPCLITMATVQ